MNDEETQRLIDELVADGGEDLAGRRSNPRETRAVDDDQGERLIDELMAAGGEDLGRHRSTFGRTEP